MFTKVCVALLPSSPSCSTHTSACRLRGGCSLWVRSSACFIGLCTAMIFSVALNHFNHITSHIIYSYVYIPMYIPSFRPIAALPCVFYNFLSCLDWQPSSHNSLAVQLFLLDGLYHACTLMGVWHLYYVSYVTTRTALALNTSVYVPFSEWRVALPWIVLGVLNLITLIVSFVQRDYTNQNGWIVMHYLSLIFGCLMMLFLGWRSLLQLQVLLQINESYNQQYHIVLLFACPGQNQCHNCRDASRGRH